MIVHCDRCIRVYDDAQAYTICPHNSLAVGPSTPYCREHDLYDCPYCTGSKQDALGVCQPGLPKLD